MVYSIENRLKDFNHLSLLYTIHQKGVEFYTQNELSGCLVAITVTVISTTTAAAGSTTTGSTTTGIFVFSNFYSKRSSFQAGAVEGLNGFLRFFIT